MARRSRIEIDEDTELDMTPMLDVVFILLIFFIVTSVFVKMPGVDPLRPVAKTAQEAKPAILVAVDAQNEIWVDKRPYQLGEARLAILALRDENPKADGIIIGDKRANVGVVMGVQAIMSDLNIPTKISTD